MRYNLAFINGRLDDLSEILETLGKWLKERKVEILSLPIGIIEENISERKIGYVFKGDIEGDNKVKVEKIEEPDFKNILVALHKGSYNTIGMTYSRIFEYLDKNDYKPRLPYREIYLSREPGSLIEIQIPIEKISR